MDPKHNQNFAVETLGDTPPPTPTAMASSAQALIKEIRAIHLTLSTLSSLAPGTQINALLTRLVDLCISPRADDFAEYVWRIEGVEELCGKLRSICAEAEGELERYWAQRIIESAPQSQSQSRPAPSALLALFPYHSNYISLSHLECSTLEAFLPTCSPICRPVPCSIAFLGSGPLPLTSFCVLDRYPEAVVYNIDRDADALRLSEQVSRKVGYEARMRFCCEDVSLGGKRETKRGWRDSEVVFLAALVGLDSVTKLSILRDLAQQLVPGTLVVARSARGLRRVLYPVLELSDNLQRIGFEILAEVHPWTKVVNSVVVLKVRER
ncbi:Nicotianamine synthase [Melanomma pulvis-pyrius CBS 109.77]|uniref:Nicotianamine synthase n=1 Tax=Melanomma pulvis-pyrius CBS 109.77 TaxID=1314802 RepID=A0A6A6X9B0_9PLEO|nr:Nicotianamine synthase [Melanomma pulvis-pyrius CBS 109.77]